MKWRKSPFASVCVEALSLLPLGPFGGGMTGRRSMGAIVHVPRERLEEARDLLASVTPPPEEGR